MPTLPKGWDNPPAREAIALQGSREREGQWGKPFAWKPREHSPQLQACVRPHLLRPARGIHLCARSWQQIRPRRSARQE